MIEIKTGKKGFHHIYVDGRATRKGSYDRRTAEISAAIIREDAPQIAITAYLAANVAFYDALDAKKISKK